MIFFFFSFFFFFLSLGLCIYITHAVDNDDHFPHPSGLIYILSIAAVPRHASIHHSASLISLFADIPLSASITHGSQHQTSFSLIPQVITCLGTTDPTHTIYSPTLTYIFYQTDRMSLLLCTHGAHAAGGFSSVRTNNLLCFFFLFCSTQQPASIIIDFFSWLNVLEQRHSSAAFLFFFLFLFLSLSLLDQNL